MTYKEKRICDMILREGTIISDKEFIDKHGRAIRQYVIEYMGVCKLEYHLTKCNGEWIYIFCSVPCGVNARGEFTHK